jgi:hypothetical protein
MCDKQKDWCLPKKGFVKILQRTKISRNVKNIVDWMSRIAIVFNFLYKAVPVDKV